MSPAQFELLNVAERLADAYGDYQRRRSPSWLPAMWDLQKAVEAVKAERVACGMKPENPAEGSAR